MSRLDKLYMRLDNLELELSKLIKCELEKESQGDFSLYLTRQDAGPGWTSKRKSDESTNEAEKLEHEIINLRHKLNLSLEEGPILILNEYIELKKDKSLLSLDKNGFSKSLSHRAISNQLIEKHYKS